MIYFSFTGVMTMKNVKLYCISDLFKYATTKLKKNPVTLKLFYFVFCNIVF